jgi:hypothetical protein
MPVIIYCLFSKSIPLEEKRKVAIILELFYRGKPVPNKAQFILSFIFQPMVLYTSSSMSVSDSLISFSSQESDIE